jgi:hypothetical protein
MRALVLALAVAVSPIALTICQFTCSQQAMAHQRQDAKPACHESGSVSGGIALGPDGRCHRADSDVQFVKASRPFPSLATAVRSLTALPIRPPASRFADRIPLAPSLTPPLSFSPLRI